MLILYQCTIIIFPQVKNPFKFYDIIIDSMISNEQLQFKCRIDIQMNWMFLSSFESELSFYVLIITAMALFAFDAFNPSVL